MADQRLYVQGQDYTLAGSGIGSTDTSIVISTLTLPNSGTLITMSMFGIIGFATLEPDTNREENISFTGITQNANGTATITGVTRGLKFVSPYDQDLTLRKSHAGSTPMRFTNSVQLYDSLANKYDNETIVQTWTFNASANSANPILDNAAYVQTLDTEYIHKKFADDTYVPLDGSVPMTGDLDMDGNKIINLGTCTDPDDAANKAYVDATASFGAPAADEVTPGIVIVATQNDFDTDTDTQTIGPLTFYNMPQISQINAAVTAAVAAITTKISIQTNQVVVAGAETTLYTTSITGGTLGTNDGIRFSIMLSEIALTDNTGNLTIRLKYGATTLCTAILNNDDSSAWTFQGYIEGMVLANGATNAQKGMLTIISGNGEVDTGTIPDTVSFQDYGTSAEDSTTNKNLVITAQCTDAQITSEAICVEKIR
jgi:hypothetical protein